MVFKKNLTAPKVGGSRRGSIVKHAGKGSQATSLPNRNTLNKLQRPPTNTMNDFAKAAPTPPSPDPSAGFGGGGGYGGAGAGTAGI